MAQELSKLNINYKPVCNGCNNAEPYQLTKRSDLLDRQVLTEVITLGCRHEKVCKEYRESDKED